MVKQVEVSAQELNEGDVFILDNEKKIFQVIEILFKKTFCFS